MSQATPRSIQQIGRELVLVWGDGREDYLDLETLRRQCPCAMCKGEPDLHGRIHKPAARPYGLGAFLLQRWVPVGSYAIQPYWQDGHSDGIYSFEFLRDLASRVEKA